ncbi:MAG TPA: chromate resistance protein ChrB domain-containing protein [Gemmatimonadaceae bacterium]|nr:chromate resistance protein ChrB domain-containing protein [Gemmatimonadaceae bacterium]
MNASAAASAQGLGRWLLFIHQLPPKPDYLRVKVRRRLQRLGAVPLKSTVYLLPNRDDAIEDFQWLLNEVVSEGGDATICAANLLSGLSDEDAEHLFRSERDADYVELARSADAVAVTTPGASDEMMRLKRRLESIHAVDFFGATERRQAEHALSMLEHRLQPAVEAQERSKPAERPSGATWVTRKGIFIDRIASAWLIRRFIDPAASFRFVEATSRRKAGEIRFDMYGGDFTHVGDQCTFETLLDAFALADQQLGAIGEIVHDIDLKDAKFERDETEGVAAVIRGIALGNDDDQERLEQGALVFDSLYRQLQHSHRIAAE